MSYTPRDGDTVKIQLKVGKFDGLLVATDELNPALVLIPAGEFNNLVIDEKVTLVRRAEPNWSVGDIGRHWKTGILYYLEQSDTGYPPIWRAMSGYDVGSTFPMNDMAGMLEQMRIVPVEDEPDIEQTQILHTIPETHQHVCAPDSNFQHVWDHVDSGRGCHLTYYVDCDDHHVS